MTSTEIIDEYKKSKNNLESKLSNEDLVILNNYEKRNLNKIKKIRIIKNKDIDQQKIELWCDQYGLDAVEINRLLVLYFKDYKLTSFVEDWVEKYKNYIPYFDELNSSTNVLEFIFISSYVNFGLANIDDRQDYKKAELDSNSSVTGIKILGLKKEVREKSYNIKHLIRFDPIYVPAIIPVLLYYLENKSLTWETKNYYYRIVNSYMIEKYIIPSTNQNNDENTKIKIYNNKLLNVFRLLR
jgi:hypothetical protein